MRRDCDGMRDESMMIIAFTMTGSTTLNIVAVAWRAKTTLKETQRCGQYLLTYLPTYLPTYILTYLLTYL